MLPRLVAIVASSALVLGLAGAIVATPRPSPTASTTAASISYRAASSRLPTLSPAGQLAGLGALDGLALLDGVAHLDRLALGDFATRYASTLSALGENPPESTEVVRWWSQLAQQKRHDLVALVPGLVGNLDGVPYDVRDAANRAYLEITISQIEAGLASAGGTAARAADEARLDMLREVRLALGEQGQIPSRHLLAVDVAWPGQAVVALGDVAEADYVSFLVPGMFFTVQGQIVDWTEIALDIHRDKMSLVANPLSAGPILASSDSQSTSESHVAGTEMSSSTTDPPSASSIATVAWMGYETPNIFTVGALDLAHDGADALSATVDGLRAVRGDRQPKVSLITHSYGSTAASIALQRGTLDIDALAIVGSPGVAVDDVRGLGLADGAVFVGEASWDPVADIAFHGSDPGDPAFGAVQMDVGTGHDDVTGKTLGSAVGHLGYFAAGTKAMRSFALIGLGRLAEVPGQAQQILAR
ncbi:alpha/beta hydrolase [Salinibacterium hongtaonis]|uniref:alpha/beta hydrolase n=1 Tax=Homoserinimonas hongtaonis TaxID=2079791 RepID=UPI00131F2F2A|nr:alpha/beta hydrolase [Salinibacterium hongtaonis]